MKLENQATVLLVQDVVVAAEYYHDKLGFEFSYFERTRGTTPT